MSLVKKLFKAVAAADTGNPGQEGLILHLDANDVDSYDGNGSVWYDIASRIPAYYRRLRSFQYCYYGGLNINQSVLGVGFTPTLYG